MLNVLETLILPPASGIALLLAGLLLWRLRTGRVLVVVGLAWLYVAATPAFAHWLLGTLEHPYRQAPVMSGAAQAVVILAGGRNAVAPEYGGETVSARSLQRLRYGALLHRETGLPLLVSGGRVRGDEPASEARLMSGVLEGELGITVRWHEEHSRNTLENALFSARILHAGGIGHVLLVTDALHMRRAVWSFRQAGVAVTPAPTGRLALSGPPRPADFLPHPRAQRRTARALHEYLGLLWYQASLRKVAG